MLQLYVTLWGRCLCVWVSVYLELLSHFLPFKIHLTNISPILIKMVDFKNLAWATSFATQASRKFIYLPYRASGKKSYCHTLCGKSALAYIWSGPILAVAARWPQLSNWSYSERFQIGCLLGCIIYLHAWWHLLFSWCLTSTETIYKAYLSY